MRACLLLLIAATACTQYPDACDRRAVRELRTVDRLVTETRRNLARGYTYETEEYGYRAGFVICSGGDPFNVCTGNDTTYRRRAVAIDPAAEQRKLDSLLARREVLSRAAAQCVPM